MPRGGPDGGDGGKGGDVVFQAAAGLKTLHKLNLQKSYRAKNGSPGAGNLRHGKDGADVVISVPPGTLVKEADTGTVLKDLREPDQKWVYLEGGRGGKGNRHFATATRQAPRFAQPGETGKLRRVRVELNLIADVGLVGLPNAGKSTLLAALTNARPEIASYPFTTKTPHLGTLRLVDRDIVIADIPGIIEGASSGAGLGTRFLKHITRTRLLLVLIDLSEPQFLLLFDKLMGELRSHSRSLVEKKRIVLGTKMDMPQSRERLRALSRRLHRETVIGVSALSGIGLEELKRALEAEVQ